MCTHFDIVRKTNDANEAALDILLVDKGESHIQKTNTSHSTSSSHRTRTHSPYLSVSSKYTAESERMQELDHCSPSMMLPY